MHFYAIKIPSWSYEITWNHMPQLLNQVKTIYSMHLRHKNRQWTLFPSSNKHKYSFIKQEPLEIETHLKLPEEHALLQLFPSAFQLKIMKAEKINNKIKGLRDNWLTYLSTHSPTFISSARSHHKNKNCGSIGISNYTCFPLSRSASQTNQVRGEKKNCTLAIKELKCWMMPEKGKTSLTTFPSPSGRIYNDSPDFEHI